MNSPKSPCPFGEQCYRKNPEHFVRYDHCKRKTLDDRNVLSKKISTDKKTKSPLITNYFQRTKPANINPSTNDKVVDDHQVNPNPSTSSSNQKSLDQDSLKNLHEKLFLTACPNEIFLFWKFCQKISYQHPEDAFIETLGLKLVGPFDLLNNKLNESHNFKHLPLLIQIIINQLRFESITCEYHLGYFRDQPTDCKPLVVSNDSKKSCIINGEGDNIFTTFYSLLADKRFKSLTKNHHKKNLRQKLETFASENQINLIDTNRLLKQRQQQIQAPTLHQFGLIVPITNDNVGYRPLPINDTNLKLLFKRIIELDNDEQRRKCVSMKELQNIITLIQYANDEKDFGMGLEFGLDLFESGHQFFHRSSEHLLRQAYEFLDREKFFPNFTSAFR
ncbi:hypothetical protein DERP_015388 [Dermatophagoides pteronyssinus]|uniref:PBZ-type domain-containing protein n=1 Tax=Dermatophagoides pteronyssinus TaxID=6956 RepID=A0ABQ8IRI8_DERPT|nr:hypothetical protein DERP_015388 [Dermatophagoides pteronyssinus]